MIVRTGHTIHSANSTTAQQRAVHTSHNETTKSIQTIKYKL